MRISSTKACVFFPIKTHICAIFFLNCTLDVFCSRSHTKLKKEKRSFAQRNTVWRKIDFQFGRALKINFPHSTALDFSESITIYRILVSHLHLHIRMDSRSRSIMTGITCVISAALSRAIDTIPVAAIESDANTIFPT